MTQDEDQDVLAAEYVLGTLDADERTAAEAQLAADAHFAARVRDWERRLGELQAMVDPIEPPPPIWDKIRTALRAAPQEGEIRLPETPAAAAPEQRPERDAEVILLASRVRRWRRWTGLAGTMAAALLVFVGLREFYPQLLPEPWRGTAGGSGRFVAVLQQSASAPPFLLTVDMDSKTFTVRRVGAAPEQGKSHELWLVSDQLSQPRSLGVIGAGEFTTRAAPEGFDPQTIDRATFAVSLEPEGGSPTGVPTGPILFSGRLVEATPP